MTIHEQHTEFDHSAESRDLASEPVIDTHDHSLRQDEYGQDEYQSPSEPVAVDTAETSTEPAHSAQATSTQATSTQATSTQATESSAKALFAHDELSDLQSRWAGVQAAFVDDPRDSVQKADGLVSDVVEHITANFSQARSRLEEQWARGEDASTEDLRVALTRYREFFQRLIAV
jgi:hypothetical protein